MPRYDFRCETCGAVRDVTVAYERSRDLELVCTACGGAMLVAPVLSVHVGGFTASAVDGEASSGKPGGKGCGHAWTCQCAAVKLKRPNPLKPPLGSL